MFNEPCRHCSREHTYRPCTKIIKDPTTKLYKPAGLDRVEIDLGLFCNDAGRYVDEMQYCPAKWSKVNWEGMIKEYLEKKEKEEKKEKKRVVRKTENPTKKKIVTGKPIKKVVTKGVKKRKL
jgi:hypothetical protein